jgi:peptidoglycan L-alanyl-D-glutamate endopeptidase CwlK
MLATVHPDLQVVMAEAIKYYDFTILEGQRSKERQEELYKEGKSKLMNSKHLMAPSHAVDVAPFPVDFSDEPKNIHTYYYLAGVILSIAERLYIEGKIRSKIRWGGDWNRNKNFKDESFNDLVHFELDYN